METTDQELEANEPLEENPDEEAAFVAEYLARSEEKPEAKAAPVEQTAEETDPEPEPEKAGEPEKTDEKPEQPDLYTVKVDGVEQQVTLDELKKSYSGQKYIQQRMEEVANLAKQQEAKFQQELQSERQRLIALTQQVQTRGLIPPPAPLDHSMAQKDPVGYIKATAQYNAHLSAYQAQQAQLAQIAQQEVQLTQARRMQELTQGAERLKQAIPEFADPQKAEAKRAELLRAGRDHYGFTEAELTGITDPRLVQALNDAAEYRKLKANPPIPVKEGAKVVKPTGQRSEPAQLQRARLIQKATKTQSQEDWLAVIQSKL